MIRLIIVAIFLFVFLLISLPIQFIFFLIGKCGGEKFKDIVSLRLVQWAFRVILFFCGVKLTIIGEENIPKDKAVLYISNHRSIFDIVVSYSRMPTLTGFISKDSMNKVPIIRVWMRYLHCLFLDRSDIKKGLQMVLAAIDQIKKGISMTIFPEGTRSKSEDITELLPFKEGSFKIAEKSGCPIVPIAMSGTDEIFERQFPRIKSTHVILQYGTPIDPTAMDREEKKHLGATTREVIRQMLMTHNR